MKPEGRLLSLDVFRGATIAAMILVNNPGSWEESYAQLKHAAWHGWTLTDWVFPFFLWIVGVAMTFSFAKRAGKGGNIFIHMVRRAAILFGLGIIVNGFPFGLLGSEFSWATLRIPGVLQRIAICYLAGSIIMRTCGLRAQMLWGVGLLAAYSLLLTLVPVPGYGAGVLEPAGNLAWYVDSTLLRGHTWIYAPAPGFDPEGILSTLPALATLLSGVLVGRLLRSTRTEGEKVRWLILGGALIAAASIPLGSLIPINKNLWSPAYVALTTGAAMVLFGSSYWVIDVRGWQRWSRPFAIFGMNAIALFMVSELLSILLWVIQVPGSGGGEISLHDWLHARLFLPIADLHNASLLFALAFTFLMFLLAYALWKRKVFFKI